MRQENEMEANLDPRLVQYHMNHKRADFVREKHRDDLLQAAAEARKSRRGARRLILRSMFRSMIMPKRQPNLQEQEAFTPELQVNC